MTRGDPMQPLLWTTRSLRNLVTGSWRRRGHKVCPTVVGELLRGMGYSLQANSKTREGGQHIDRDAQFQYINTQATAFLAANEPVISVDTKKKELVGNFKNNGREWRAQGRPELVNVHDFIDPKLSPRRALRRLRHHQQCRMGQRRHRSRHRQLRGQCDPPMVADDGKEAPSR